MSVTPGARYLRSSQTGGFPTDVKDALTTLAGASSSLTKASYGSLETGVTRFQPQATRSTRDTVPSAGDAAADMGWRTGALASDKLATVANSWSASTRLSTTAVAGVTADLTAIAYLDGVEVGRGTTTGNVITSTVTTFGVTFTATGGIVSASTAPYVQVEIYLTVTVAPAVTYTVTCLTDGTGASTAPRITPGVMNVQVALGGSTDGTSTTTAAMKCARPLAGSTSGAATTAGTARCTRALAGSTAGTSGATGDLTDTDADHTHDHGGAPGAYILGGGGPRPRPRRRKKKQQTPPWFDVEVTKTEPAHVVVDLAAQRRRADEDALLLTDALF